MRAFIFDLDGTLFDSIDDIANSANLILEQHGFPVHARDRYFQFVGNGLEQTLRSALPDVEQDVFKALYLEFLEAYALRYRDMSRPYPDVISVLKELNNQAIPIAICTNKRQSYADGIVEMYFSEIQFTHVVGDRNDGYLKPAPHHAIKIAQEMGVPSQEVYFVGDSDVDMHTALNAGMVPVSVAWGFRSVKELKEAGAQFHLEAMSDIFSLEVQ